MACARSREPVLAKIRLTCVFTVASLTNSARAISRLDLPAAIRRSTSHSLGVRSPSPSPAAGAGARAAAKASRCCTPGSSTAWPAAAACTARPISVLVASLVR